MALLSKDQILSADDLTTEDLEVPEWGGTVRVRMMTGAERDNFEASVAQQKGKNVKANLANFRARLVAKCVVGEDNRRLFTDHEAAVLGQKSASALDRVFEAAQRLNRMSDEDVEELTEGFDDAQSEPSTTD